MHKHYRLAAGMVASSIATILATVLSARGQDIIRFENGYLRFENTDTNRYYRIEFKPNLTDDEQWTERLPDNIKSPDAEVSVAVGMFYRVVGSDTPEPILLISKTGQTASYRAGDDGDHQTGIAWLNPRFSDNGDGTVTDNATGLMWVKAPHALAGNGGIKLWDDAVDFCNGLIFAGHSDWRLPNVRELQSLIDYGKSNPALPSGHPFSGVQSSPYWSSTSNAGYTSGAWYVGLDFGHINGPTKASTSYHVFPVRNNR